MGDSPLSGVPTQHQNRKNSTEKDGNPASTGDLSEVWGKEAAVDKAKKDEKRQGFIEPTFPGKFHHSGEKNGGEKHIGAHSDTVGFGDDFWALKGSDHNKCENHEEIVNFRNIDLAHDRFGSVDCCITRGCFTENPRVIQQWMIEMPGGK
jgi:hypothetical protein